MFEYEFKEGYNAYLDWMNLGCAKPSNPYDEDAQPVEYESWKRGFKQAMDDS